MAAHIFKILDLLWSRLLWLLAYNLLFFLRRLFMNNFKRIFFSCSIFLLLSNDLNSSNSCLLTRWRLLDFTSILLDRRRFLSFLFLERRNASLFFLNCYCLLFYGFLFNWRLSFYCLFKRRNGSILHFCRRCLSIA